MLQMTRTTPFHERIADRNLLQGWERWNGYQTATTLISEAEEYFAVRASCSLYDISPMIKYRVSGSDAAKVVNRIMTRDVDRLKVGRVLYSPWCDGRGRIIEEGTIFRLEENLFQINAAEHQLHWFQQCALGYDCTIEDMSDELAGLSLQGPLSRALLEDIGLGEAGKLRFFQIGQFDFEGDQIMITRTGYTGDLGYELWVKPEQAPALWDRLMSRELERYVRPIGSTALNQVRIEAGFVLVNVEYVAANKALRQSQFRTPAAIGLDWAVDFRKANFNGRAALLRERQNGGPKQKLVGLDIEGRKPAHGSWIYYGKKEVGQIMSAMWSPVLKKNIALANVDAAYANLGQNLMVDIYYVKEITQDRVEAQARVVPNNFYNPPQKTSTPD
ncbi:aminomethyltransferase family protein [Rhodovibrionaceae bacterium A322]